MALLLALAFPAQAEATTSARQDGTMLLSLGPCPREAGSASELGAALRYDVLDALLPERLRIESR
jgi:hypothetical protein